MYRAQEVSWEVHRETGGQSNREQLFTLQGGSGRHSIGEGGSGAHSTENQLGTILGSGGYSTGKQGQEGTIPG